MRRFVMLAALAGLALVVSSAHALTLEPASTGVSWEGAWSANEDGDPYWDGNSSDYSQPGNIGNFIARTGAFAGHPQSPNNSSMPYLKGTGANAGANGMPIDVYFQTGAQPNWAAIKIEVAGLSQYNYFGIYKQGELPANLNELLTTPPGTLGSSGKSMLLFQGTDGPGQIITFVAPWSDFGFYLATESQSSPGTVAQAFFSESSLNSGNELNLQHFAFFKAGTASYYVGAEDRRLGSADKDYNDMVVYVSVVPDASTWMLFLAGMPAVLVLRRKKA
ncbi:MAG: DUF4114 domain-containing protein [Armatimonadota bacterium]